jgi:Flp pilus assembly protein TadG
MRRQKGHALLELALSAAVMVSCLTGTFRFGYTFYIYNELVTAVGNAGRYAATRSFQDAETSKAAIRNMAVYGNPSPAPGSVPVVPNLTPEQVQVSYVSGEQGGPPVAVDVSIVNYSAGGFMLDRRPSVEFPFVGLSSPAGREP